MLRLGGLADYLMEVKGVECLGCEGKDDVCGVREVNDGSKEERPLR